ncbi:MAG: F0F1 ATP synthase subunit B [Emcibacteraceae bacterium]
MQFDLWTFGLQTVNFLVLVWLLKIFLYTPVAKIIERRQAGIRAAQDEADRAKKNAENEAAQFKQKTDEIEAEREQIIADARIAESKAYDDLIIQGQSEIAHMRDLTKRDIEREKNKAKSEIRRGATELAISLSRQILAESANGYIDEYFLDKVKNHLKALPVSEFKNLQDQLKDGMLTIISAEKLQSQMKKKWQDAIQEIFESKVKLSFSVDKKLIAGVNLQFPDGLLSFNWNDILEQAKFELDKRAGGE